MAKKKGKKEASLENKIRYNKKKIHELTYTKKGTKRKRIDKVKLGKYVKNFESALNKKDSLQWRKEQKEIVKEKEKAKAMPLPVEFSIFFTNFEMAECIRYVFNNETRTYYKTKQDLKNDVQCNYFKGCLVKVEKVKRGVTKFLGLDTKKDAIEITSMIDEMFSQFFDDETDKTKERYFRLGTIIFFQRDTEIYGYEILV